MRLNMETNLKATAIIEYLRTLEHEEIQVNEGAINTAYRKQSEVQSVSLQLLTVFGGVIASLTFIGFLLAIGLYKSEVTMVMLGAVFIAGAFMVSKAIDTIIISAISMCFYTSGVAMLIWGLGELGYSANIISSVLIVVICFLLSIVQRYLLSFLSVILLHGCILSLFIANKAQDYLYIYLLALVACTSYIHLSEAKILTQGKAFIKLLYPVRIALVISVLSELSIFIDSQIFPITKNSLLLSSIGIISAIVYCFSTLFEQLGITSSRHKIIFYLIVIVALVPTVFAPGIAGALLLMLMSFKVNSKTGLIASIIGFIYFVSRYYYDLQFTLLTKSLLLLASGIFFLIVYVFVHKTLTPNEEV